MTKMVILSVSKSNSLITSEIKRAAAVCPGVEYIGDSWSVGAIYYMFYAREDSLYFFRYLEEACSELGLITGITVESIN